MTNETTITDAQVRAFKEACWNGEGGDEAMDESVRRGLAAALLAAPQPNAALADGCAPLIARARDEWHEDDGPVMWWAWCGHGWAGEPAWCGTPLCSDWPGYHTHWTPHPAPPTLNASKEASNG